MKTVGLVGGLGPESTVDYYKLIMRRYRERYQTEDYPRLLLESLNLTEGVRLVGAADLNPFIEFILRAVDDLARAGAEFGAIAANTPHIVFDQVQARSPIPLISIVEATRDRARDLKMTRLGLLGTGFTMRSSFYPDCFRAASIEIVVPPADQQQFIHHKILDELQEGLVTDEARHGIIASARELIEKQQIDGLILGCTELPTVLKPDDPALSLPLLNTTEIHVDQIVQSMSV